MWVRRSRTDEVVAILSGPPKKLLKEVTKVEKDCDREGKRIGRIRRDNGRLRALRGGVKQAVRRPKQIASQRAAKQERGKTRGKVRK